MGMTWRQGPQDFIKLNKLGNVTARLIRIAMFDKIQKGEALLMSQGAPPGLVDAYKKHALTQRQVLIPQKEEELENYLNVKATERSTF